MTSSFSPNAALRRARGARARREAPESLPAPARAAHLLEGGGRTDGHLHATGEIAVLLAELGEHVLQSPLERPLEMVEGLRHRQIDGRRGVGSRPAAVALSNTWSSTSTGTPARSASAIASDGRESRVRSPVADCRWSTA